MIRLWLSRSGSVPMREQLAAQLLLGILSGRLGPGERLPSVRELARRLKLHSNTIHAVYRDLADRGWVESRAGSGMFVVEHELRPPELGLDGLVREWMEAAETYGFTPGAVLEAVERAVREMRPQRLVVVDTDPELARIIAAELSEACGHAVESRTVEGPAFEAGTCVQVSSGQAKETTPKLGATPFRVVHLKSMQEVLEGRQRPGGPVLIGVVSRSDSVTKWATTLLSALGFDPDSVLLRNPRAPGWRDGLAACDLIGADVVAAAELPAKFKAVAFRVVADESLEEIRRLVTAEEVSQTES